MVDDDDDDDDDSSGFLRFQIQLHSSWLWPRLLSQIK